jgi:hypothetical protein
MELFQAPSFADKLAGQPIQQLRMRRFAAIKAEVVWAIDQARAEMILLARLSQT